MEATGGGEEPAPAAVAAPCVRGRVGGTDGVGVGGRTGYDGW